MRHKFRTWAENLFQGVESSSGYKARVNVTVQREGGYQNAFIFAQREPVSTVAWERLERQEVHSFLEKSKSKDATWTTTATQLGKKTRGFPGGDLSV